MTTERPTTINRDLCPYSCPEGHNDCQNMECPACGDCEFCDADDEQARAKALKELPPGNWTRYAHGWTLPDGSVYLPADLEGATA